MIQVPVTTVSAESIVLFTAVVMLLMAKLGLLMADDARSPMAQRARAAAPKRSMRQPFRAARHPVS